MTKPILSFTRSDEEVSYNMPSIITIESNISATIYYTLDGNDPTINSAIYISPLSFSTDTVSLTLKAFGISFNNEEGEMLSEYFGPDLTDVDRSLRGKTGKILDKISDTTNTPIGFNYTGESNAFLDLETTEVDFLDEDRGRLGIYKGTSVSVTKLTDTQTNYPYDDNYVSTSNTIYASSFNPNAKFIVMDQRKSNEVSIINRPHGSMRNISTDFGGKQLYQTARDGAYISGGFVRRYYDAKHALMASYYFDHNECRYIRNVQEAPSIFNNVGFVNMTFPFVVRWIDRGRHSTIV